MLVPLMAREAPLAVEAPSVCVLVPPAPLRRASSEGKQGWARRLLQRRPRYQSRTKGAVPLWRRAAASLASLAALADLSSAPAAPTTTGQATETTRC